MRLHDEALTDAIIGSAIEVHRAMGPGLLESVYQRCLSHELELRGIAVAELPLDLRYKGLLLLNFNVPVLKDGIVRRVL